MAKLVDAVQLTQVAN